MTNLYFQVLRYLAFDRFQPVSELEDYGKLFLDAAAELADEEDSDSGSESE